MFLTRVLANGRTGEMLLNRKRKKLTGANFADPRHDPKTKIEKVNLS